MNRANTDRQRKRSTRGSRRRSATFWPAEEELMPSSGLRLRWMDRYGKRRAA